MITCYQIKMSKYAKPWNIKWEQPSQIPSHPDDTLCDQSVKIYNALKCQMEKNITSIFTSWWHVTVWSRCQDCTMPWHIEQKQSSMLTSRLHNMHWALTCQMGPVTTSMSTSWLCNIQWLSYTPNTTNIASMLTRTANAIHTEQHGSYISERVHTCMKQSAPTHTKTHQRSSIMSSGTRVGSLIHWPDCAGLLVLLQLWKKIKKYKGQNSIYISERMYTCMKQSTHTHTHTHTETPMLIIILQSLK